MSVARNHPSVLTAAQATLVHLPTEGQFLVRGAAGAGKSTVALARALHVARQPLLHGAARVLLLARSPSLAADLAARRDALAPQAAARIDVDFAASWCHRFLATPAAPAPPLRRGEFELLVGLAVQLVRRRNKRLVLRQPLSFFTSEFHSMVLSLGLERLEEYLAVEREGRARPLDDESRKAVFAVFAEVRRLAARFGRTLPMALVPAALRRLATTRAPPYDHVVVDDAHLLAPIELKLVRALSSGGSLTLFSALEHRFDPLAAKLTELGLGRLDRTEVLPRSLRGPKAIYKAALAILKRRGGASSSDLKAIVPDAIDGPRPRLIVAADWQGELDALVGQLQLLQREGRPLADAAVLAASEGDLELVATALAAAGLPAQHVRDDESAPLRPDAVRLVPLHAAPGREFPLLFLLDCNLGAYPRQKQDLAPHERPLAVENAARLLHLALTRATEEALLFASEPTLSPLLPKKLIAIERAPDGEATSCEPAAGAPIG